MKKYRRALALILSAGMIAALLAGCGGKEGSGNKGTEGKPVDEDGNVVIRIAVSGEGSGSGSDPVDDLIRGFQAQGNNITFQKEYIVGDYTTKLITQVSAGTAPDLIWINDIQTQNLASKGALADLSQYYDEMNFDSSDMYESMLKCGQYDGKQYMLPRDYNHVVTYYNKKLFAEAGVPEPQDGWTWEEFVETAYKFPQKKGDVYTRRGCAAWLTWGATAPIILMGLGGSLTDPYPNGTEANFNTPGTVKALTEIKKLVDDGVLVNEYRNDIGDFQSGKVAMTFHTRSTLSAICNAVGAENVGVTTFPILPEQHIVGSGSSGFAVINNSKVKDEAARFVFYVVSEEGQRVFSKTGNCVPVLKSMAEDDVWRNSVEGIPAEPFLDSTECDVLQPALTLGNLTAGTRFDGCWMDAFSAVLTGIMTPQEAAEFAHQELVNAFQRK